MPWNAQDQKFIRTNSVEFSGPDVWYKDQQASIKIIATRHDYHDQDIADGISRTLNIDGINKMYANLDMNNFRIINLTDGSGDDDVAKYGQIFDTMTFDDPSRTLTLSRPSGVSLTAIIPGGTSGGGVTSISIGGGLTGSSNPITTTGTISMATVGARTGSNGIGSITVDQYGRVTDLSDNYGAGYLTEVNQSPAGATWGRQYGQWVEISQSGAGQVDLTLLRTATINRVGTDTGGSSIDLVAADTDDAGLLLPADYVKLSNLPGPGGSTIGAFMVWEGASLKWSENTIIRWDGAGGLEVNGDIVPNNPYTHDGVTVDAFVVEGPIVTEGILIKDPIPNIEFSDTSNPETNFALTQNDSIFIVKGAESAAAVTKYFQFEKSSLGSTDIERLNAKGGAEFTVDGTPVALNTQLVSLLSLLVTKGTISQVEADAIAT